MSPQLRRDRHAVASLGVLVVAAAVVLAGIAAVLVTSPARNCTVVGRTYSGDGSTPLSGVTVVVAVRGQGADVPDEILDETRSGWDGSYRLAVVCHERWASGFYGRASADGHHPVLRALPFSTTGPVEILWNPVLARV